MDKETFELYYGEKEADRAYVVSLPGGQFHDAERLRLLPG